MNKLFWWFIVVMSAFFAVFSLVEVGFGIYTGDKGEQALGLVHFIMWMVGLVVGYSIANEK